MDLMGLFMFLFISIVYLFLILFLIIPVNSSIIVDYPNLGLIKSLSRMLDGDIRLQ